MTFAPDLVEQQIKRWTLAQRQKPDVLSPCVAFSRQPGTPAAAIGQRVAEQLGYGFFGIELVDEIARSEGVSRDLVEHMDEHVRDGLDRWLLDTFRAHTWTEKEYLYSVGRTISALADKGSAVIIGRGAPFLLGAHQALRVQVIGSRIRREQRLAEAKSLPAEAARAALASEEQDRTRFLKAFVDDPDAAGHFDIVVNSDERSVEYWAEVIVSAVNALGESR